MNEKEELLLIFLIQVDVLLSISFVPVLPFYSQSLYSQLKSVNLKKFTSLLRM